MPMFFALSGYTLYKFGKQISFQKFLMKRTKTILWPFILFRILLVIYWIVIESHFRALDMGPIWFLIVLYVVELIAYPIFYFNKSRGLTLFAVWCIIAVLLRVLLGSLPITVLTAWMLRFLNGLLWYLMGYIYGIIEYRIKHLSLTKTQNIVLMSIFLLLSFIVGYLNPGVSMFSNTYGKYYLLFIVGGIIGSLWLGFVCKQFIKSNKFLENIGQNTITILAVHEPIKRIVLKIAEMGMQYIGINITVGQLQDNTLCSLVVVALVITLNLIVVDILRRVKFHLPIRISKRLMTFVK